MNYENHLYVILYPINALVGSHLDYQEFARHYNSGSSKYYSGKLIFAELDNTFRHPYFQLEDRLLALRPHEDGKPKATKYFSNYRVLEHIDFSALGRLFIATPEGHVLELESGPYEAKHQTGMVRIFGEIAPISVMVLSDYNFLEFAKFITVPGSPVGAPKMFYTQIDLEIDDFLKKLESNPLRQSPIPEVHPSVLRDGILEIQNNSNKHTKGLSLADPLGKISFKSIRHGFMFASQDQNRFYPMPLASEIEKKNYKFWKYM